MFTTSALLHADLSRSTNPVQVKPDQWDPLASLTRTVPVDHADVTLTQCLRNKSFTGFIIIQEIPENIQNF